MKTQGPWIGVGSALLWHPVSGSEEEERRYGARPLLEPILHPGSLVLMYTVQASGRASGKVSDAMSVPHLWGPNTCFLSPGLASLAFGVSFGFSLELCVPSRK